MVPSLYGFQKQAVDELCSGKNFCILPTGAGKTAVMFRWLLRQGKKRVIIVTTATKAKSGDMEREAVLWNGQEWLDGLEEFKVMSWHVANKWLTENRRLLYRCGYKYSVAFDEVQKSKGYTTGMGKAFRGIAKIVSKWSGYTATPGDKWIDFISYFTATNKVRTKTEFLEDFATVATYKGYPEIICYNDVDEIERMWKSVASIPNADQMFRELPPETHKVIKFSGPKDYWKIAHNSTKRDGEFIDSTMGLCHYLRQICFTDEKKAWLSDFIEGLGTNCVFFCNYIEEEEVVCEIARKVLPKEAKIWRIDGQHHEIPTKDTIGKYDIVVAHYASGGEALNLQFMNYWCSVSPNYSYSSSIQARGRIKRIGQKKPMYFYYLKTLGTIEEDIYSTLADKKDFSEKTWLADKGIEVV